APTLSRCDLMAFRIDDFNQHAFLVDMEVRTRWTLEGHKRAFLRRIGREHAGPESLLHSSSLGVVYPSAEGYNRIELNLHAKAHSLERCNMRGHRARGKVAGFRSCKKR